MDRRIGGREGGREGGSIYDIEILTRPSKSGMSILGNVYVHLKTIPTRSIPWRLTPAERESCRGLLTRPSKSGMSILAYAFSQDRI